MINWKTIFSLIDSHSGSLILILGVKLPPGKYELLHKSIRPMCKTFIACKVHV